MLTWIAVAVIAVLVFLAALDVYWPITVALLAAVLAGAFYFGWPILTWVAAHPWWIVAYFAAGIPWVFFRWTRLVETALKSATTADRRHTTIKAPEWSDHKWDFAPSYFYWPIDAVAYLLSDALREAWRVVSAMVSDSFDRYSRWRFSKLVATKQEEPMPRMTEPRSMR